MAASFADEILGSAESKTGKKPNLSAKESVSGTSGANFGSKGANLNVKEPNLSANGTSLNEDEVRLIHACYIYEMEYDHCKQRQSRNHQKFVDGEKSDCTIFKQLFDECENFDSNGDVKSANFLINYEKSQRRDRQLALLRNNVWNLRSEPPADFNAELPDYLQKRLQGTLLEAEQRAIDRQNNGGANLSRYEQIRAQIGWDRLGCSIM